MASGEHRARRAASPWVLFAVGTVLALAVAGIAVAVVLGGDSDETSSTTATRTGTAGETSTVEALPEGSDVDALFDGIQQRGNQLGDPDAPAAMIEYIDMQCPYCAAFDTEAVPRLIRKYVRTGKLFLEIRPIAALGEDSRRARAAVLAAGLQGKGFQLAHLLYLHQGTENSGWVTDQLLASAAASISGLDVEQFQIDRVSEAVAAQGSTFDSQARQASVAVTPTIYVGKNGGKLEQVTPAFPADDATVAKAIDKAIG